jgi:hypothetical protein
LTPYAPKPACPKCRRVNCTDASHRAKPHGWSDGNTRARRPRYADTEELKRRGAAVRAWLGANAVVGEDGKRYACCPDCFTWQTQFVADHVVPVALGGGEDGPLRVHCRRCSDRQGSAIARTRRRRRA